MTESITPRQFEQSEGAAAWRVTCDGGTAVFRTGSLGAGVRFAAAIAELDGLARNQPDLDLRHDSVTVRLVTVTDTSYGMTRRDAELAARISAIAAEQGLTADPDAIQSMLIVPGAPDIASITPFWRAVLGYVPRPDSPDEDLVDPRDRGVPFWFEGMDEPRPGGLGAIHVSVFLSLEAARARVEAGLAAGGTLVRDQFAPAWWTLADAAGNEIDISTVSTRD